MFEIKPRENQKLEVKIVELTRKSLTTIILRVSATICTVVAKLWPLEAGTLVFLKFGIYVKNPSWNRTLKPGFGNPNSLIDVEKPKM